MTTFPRTRTVARYALQHAASDIIQERAAALLNQLATCEAALTNGTGDLPAAGAGLLRSLVLATRDLAGPAWLAAQAGIPAVAVFTALLSAPALPAPGRLDEALARVIWVRFAPHPSIAPGLLAANSLTPTKTGGQ